MDNLLSIITFIPAVAALIMALFLRGDDKAAETNAKWLALLATIATFLVSLFLLIGFDPANRCCPDERYIRLGSGLDATDRKSVV